MHALLYWRKSIHLEKVTSLVTFATAADPTKVISHPASCPAQTVASPAMLQVAGENCWDENYCAEIEVLPCRNMCYLTQKMSTSSAECLEMFLMS